MKPLLTIIIIAAFATQISNTPVPKKFTGPTYRAESSAHVISTEEADTYITDNHSFQFVEVLGDTGSYEAVLLLEKAYRNERTDFIEGSRGSATIRAWTIGKQGSRTERWILTESGNEGEVQDRFFRVVSWGCCDIPTLFTYFNLLDGKKLYTSNSDLLRVWGDGEGPQAFRFVAFGYPDQQHFEKPPQLQYGTDRKVKQCFSLVSKREYYDDPVVSLSTGRSSEKSLDLRGTPLSFDIILRYFDGVELRIPVKDDTVHIEKAVLPPGYSLVPETN